MLAQQLYSLYQKFNISVGNILVSKKKTFNLINIKINYSAGNFLLKVSISSSFWLNFSFAYEFIQKAYTLFRPIDLQLKRINRFRSTLPLDSNKMEQKKKQQI